MRIIRRASPLYALLAAAGMLNVAQAHHAAANYDMDKQVTLDGVITRFEFVNPHAYVYFDVQADGVPTQHWRCEMSSATSMKRLGWTAESFVPDEQVTIRGSLARHEDDVCFLESVEFDDGARVERMGRFERGGSADRGSEPADRLDEHDAADTNATEFGTEPLRLANGRPNLSGSWVSESGPGGRPGAGPAADRIGASTGGRFGAPTGGRIGVTSGRRSGGPAGGLSDRATGGRIGPPGDGERGRPPGGPRDLPQPTRAGARAAEGYDQPYDDPAIQCHPANIIFAWNHDRHVNEIRQDGDVITLQYGYMDLVRTIDLDESEHPDIVTPSVAGHSIGHWDGDVLVVDTLGFEQGVLIPLTGLMHSADLQITERFVLADDGRTLTRSYTAHDPAFLQSDLSGQDVMRRTAEPYTPYACTELSGDNNRR